MPWQHQADQTKSALKSTVFLISSLFRPRGRLQDIRIFRHSRVLALTGLRSRPLRLNTSRFARTLLRVGLLGRMISSAFIAGRLLGLGLVLGFHALGRVVGFLSLVEFCLTYRR